MWGAQETPPAAVCTQFTLAKSSSRPSCIKVLFALRTIGTQRGSSYPFGIVSHPLPSLPLRTVGPSKAHVVFLSHLPSTVPDPQKARVFAECTKVRTHWSLQGHIPALSESTEPGNSPGGTGHLPC